MNRCVPLQTGSFASADRTKRTTRIGAERRRHGRNGTSRYHYFAASCAALRATLPHAFNAFPLWCTSF